MIEKTELEQLEKNLKKYLRLIKRGEFNDARLVARSLEYACYVLDPVWVEGDKRKRERERGY